MHEKIAICGKICAGKTTLASNLEWDHGFKRLSFAEPIKRYAGEIFGMKGKDRALIQDFGQKMREIDGNVWIKMMERELDVHSNEKVVIDDVRFWDEFLMLRDRQFLIVRLDVEEEEQLRRIRKLYGDEANGHIQRLKHESEGYVNEFPVNIKFGSCSDALHYLCNP